MTPGQREMLYVVSALVLVWVCIWAAGEGEVALAWGTGISSGLLLVQGVVIGCREALRQHAARRDGRR